MAGVVNRHDRIAEVLRASHLFGVLDAAVLSDLAGHLELQTVPGGSLVLREGDLSETMIIVVTGRLRVSRRDADGSLLLYNEICPGESVGETGLILRQARTADVTAVRDSTLAVLHRSSFEALMALRPLELNRVFSQAIFNHLRHKPQTMERRNAQSFAVVPVHEGARAGEVAEAIGKAFAKHGKTYRISLSAEQEIAARDIDEAESADRFDAMESRFDYLIYEAEASPSALTRRAFRQADQVIFVANAGASPAVGELEKLLCEEPGFAMKRKHLVLLHPADAAVPNSPAAWQAGRDLERTYVVRSGNLGDFAHLTRFLTGTAVGVVLGGGGARGFAHLGVLRALKECGIPIDLVGGNSMGALIGAQYACDVPLDEILARTQKFALGGERVTLPLVSLLAGKRIERDMRRMFGDINIEDLWRPYFAAACNLSRACTTVQDSGPLWRAVLASNSPAGLLPPVLYKGQLLVDGAILDNVPVDAMRARLGTPLEKRRGNGTIIAIDVDVRDELLVDASLTHLSAWDTIKNYFSSSRPPTPGIGEILYRAGHIGGLNQRARTMSLADRYLEPPVAEFKLMDYRRPAEIAEIGYRYAMQEIEQWNRKN